MNEYTSLVLGSACGLLAFLAITVRMKHKANQMRKQHQAHAAQVRDSVPVSTYIPPQTKSDTTHEAELVTQR